MVYVQKCIQGIFLEDNRPTVFVFSNFNTKSSSFDGSNSEETHG